jgi:ComF family protein
VLGLNALEHLLDLLFPPRCPFCDKLLQEGESLLCARCQRQLPWTEGDRGEQKLEFVECCVSPLWYREAVRTAFHRYKFTGRRDHAPVYGALMAQCVTDRLAGRYDLLTYVPLSARSRRRRGYDQVRLLGRELSRRLDLPLTDTLVKTRATQAQSGLRDDGARRANVLGAYQTRKDAPVAGKRVLLVDDVVTTGSTLSECARTLRTAGAAEVVCVTLARARG